jgi:hypothetical protein
VRAAVAVVGVGVVTARAVRAAVVAVAGVGAGVVTVRAPPTGLASGVVVVQVVVVVVVLEVVMVVVVVGVVVKPLEAGRLLMLERMGRLIDARGRVPSS